MDTCDAPPKWAIILNDLIEMAEDELKESEKGTAPAAPNNKTTHLLPPVKARWT